MKCVVSSQGGWCPECYSGAKARKFYPGHLGFRPAVSTKGRFNVPILRSTESPGRDEVPAKAACDGPLTEQYPALLEYLTDTLFADGSCRQTSTLLMFAEEGVWKVCLNDRSEQRSLWVSGSSWAEALARLDDALHSGRPEWRRQPAKGKR